MGIPTADDAAGLVQLPDSLFGLIMHRALGDIGDSEVSLSIEDGLQERVARRVEAEQAKREVAANKVAFAVNPNAYGGAAYAGHGHPSPHHVHLHAATDKSHDHDGPG